MSKKTVCIVCAVTEGLLHYVPCAFLLDFFGQLHAYHAEYEHLTHVPLEAAFLFAVRDYPSWFLLMLLLYQIVVVIHFVVVLTGGPDKAFSFRLSLLYYCGAGVLASAVLSTIVRIATGEFSILFILDAIFLALVFAVCLKIHRDETL